MRMLEIFRDGFNCDLTRTYIQLAEGGSNLEKTPSMKKTFIWLAVTLLLFTACKKTQTQTQAEINASALKSSFLPGNISSVTVFKPHQKRHRDHQWVCYRYLGQSGLGNGHGKARV